MMKTFLRFSHTALVIGCGLCVLVSGWPLRRTPVAFGQDLKPNQTERVVAVVNNEAVTAYDLAQRVLIALTSSGIAPSAEINAQITPQVLRRLIDEHLETQEAKKLKLSVANAEIEERITSLAQRNNLTLDAFESALKSRGIDLEELRQQVRAELAWTAVVRSEVLPGIQIGEDEITGRLQEYRANIGKPEYLASDIFLAVEDTSRDREILELALRLSDQIRQGTPFAALAQQFSQSGAANGGDLGWVSRNMVDDAVFAKLSEMQPDELSPPVRAADGYHILYLRAKRIAGEATNTEPTLDISYLDITSLPSANATDVVAQEIAAEKAVAGSKSCDDYEMKAKTIPTAKFFRAGKLLRAQLPPDVAALVTNLRAGQMSEPASDGTLHRFYILCGRFEPRNGIPSRDEIRLQLQNERADLAARRYLRDLRRDAFVQFRI
jgi:peptidyl-prolyl cis-trans isomerase SurA